MELNKITIENVYLLQNFIKLNNSQNFRYYKTRNISIIRNHLITIILTEDKNIIGYGHLDKDESNKTWLGICVLEKYTGKGYGKKIIEYLIDYAIYIKLDTIYLTVDIDNIIAKKLYFKYNFFVKERKNNIYEMVKYLEQSVKEPFYTLEDLK